MRYQGQTSAHESKPPSSNRRKVVVIADDGFEASVAILDAAACATEGSIFEHRSRQWVIRGRRHHSRVLVAEPVARERQTQAKKRDVTTRTCSPPNT